MNTGNVIEHTGFVERITGNSIVVKILSQSACGHCNAKTACNISEMQEKEVEVTVPKGEFKTGEMVNLVMSQADGYNALLIAYIIPFLLVFSILTLTTVKGVSELKAGLFSLSVLPVYYLALYLLKNKIRRKFNFSVRKIN